ncbi:5-oxoprolinase subunit PxpA [Dokdonia sp. Asnod2-E02]|uniref:5-oxoprolinase subunit PxpA n=1 Tax=Dokdonia sp. Asnod2-E02 TaxID=3160574 RepID=UPI003870B2E4
MISIDINSDVGEGIGNEALLMPLISSCNIACGGHAGDEKTMREVLAFAKAYNVKIGAHPSYPDKENFGRLPMDISKKTLQESLRNQITTLKNLAEESGLPLHHIKPHGALYNKAARDEETAMIVIETVHSIDKNLALYVPYGSLIARLARPRLKTIVEGFADRAYNSDYSLVSRSEYGSVLHDTKQVLTHVLSMVKDEILTTRDGKNLSFKIDTICVHGDTENALEIVRNLHTKLTKKGIQII